MINWTLPYGSRQRNFLRTVHHRISNSQKWRSYHAEYNSVRQDFYSNHVMLRTDEKDFDPLITLVVLWIIAHYRYLYVLMDSVFAQSYTRWQLISVRAKLVGQSDSLIKDLMVRRVIISHFMCFKKEGRYLA